MRASQSWSVRHMCVHLWSLTLCVASAASLSAQTVIVTVVDTTVRQSRHGVTALLLTAPDSVVDSDVSRPEGRIVLTARRQGVYWVRLLRIGYQSVETSRHLLSLGDTLRVEVAAPAHPIQLTAVRVQEKRDCGDMVPANGPAFQLWDEARKALRATVATRNKARFPATVRDYRREIDPISNRIRRETRSDRHGVVRTPYHSPSPQSLADDGYVQVKDGQLWYFAPDAETLLSDQFVASHCFRSAKHDSIPSLIGLAFAPSRPHRRRTDIRGTLWIDARQGSLTAVDYTYEPMDPQFARAGVGGRIEFAALENGTWIVKRWFVRAPQSATTRTVGISELGRLQHGVGSARLVSIIEEGGEVVPQSPAILDRVTPATGELITRADVSCVSDSSGAVRGRLRFDAANLRLPATLSATWKSWRYTAKGLSWVTSHVANVTSTDGTFQICHLPPETIVTVELHELKRRDTVRTRAAAHSLLDFEATTPHGFSQIGGSFADGLVVTAADYPTSPVTVQDGLVRTGSWRAAFEKRRSTARGFFWIRDSSESPQWRTASALIASLPDLSERWIGSPEFDYLIVSSRRREQRSEVCSVTYFLNGVRQVGGRSQLFVNVAVRPQDIEAIEAYPDPSFSPPEFGDAQSGCGVVAIWTRRVIGQ